MAPTAANVERQTSLIIKYLFEDEDEASYRQFNDGLETDGPGDEDDSFDPVEIADKLRQIAEVLNKDPKFQAAVTDLKRVAGQEAMEAAFSHSVDALCKTQLPSCPDLAPEMQLINASVAIGLYIKNSIPELKNNIQSVVSSFIQSRVGTWIDRQGGWEKVTDVSA